LREGLFIALPSPRIPRFRKNISQTELWAEDNSLAHDLDELIEEGRIASTKFYTAESGEVFFREKEAAVLRNTDRFDQYYYCLRLSCF